MISVDELDPARAALCIVEMQNDIVHESNIGQRGIGGVLAEQVQKRGVIPRLHKLLTAARVQKLPILYVNFALKPGFPRPHTKLHQRSQRRATLVEGTWGVKVHEALEPHPEDFVLERTVSVDGSYGTQLYPVLGSLGCTTMIMTGVSTNLAVEGIVRASVNRNFDVVVVEDCCASYPDEWHRFSVENILPLLAAVTSADELMAKLDGSVISPATSPA